MTGSAARHMQDLMSLAEPAEHIQSLAQGEVFPDDYSFYLNCLGGTIRWFGAFSHLPACREKGEACVVNGA